MKSCSPTYWVMSMMFSRLVFVSQSGAEDIGMVTGTATRTTRPFRQEIAKVAQKMGFDILVKEFAGSSDNICRLVSAENATLGIVQLDVLGSLNRLTDLQMRRIVSGLRLMCPSTSKRSTCWLVRTSEGAKTAGEFC